MVDLLIQQKGIEKSRHCEGGHNPVAQFSGALTTGSVMVSPFDEEGVTCVTCHSIQRVGESRGLGSYVLGTPTALLDARGEPIAGMPAAGKIDPYHAGDEGCSLYLAYSCERQPWNQIFLQVLNDTGEFRCDSQSVPGAAKSGERVAHFTCPSANLLAGVNFVRIVSRSAPADAAPVLEVTLAVEQ